MKILIVDDIKGWIEYHSQMIKKLFPNSIVEQAESAREAYDKVLMKTSEPYDIILTDMQMENNFEPKYAGEWLIEQIKSLPSYSKTNIVIISAAYNIKFIAENYGVNYIRKSTARNFPDSYAFLKD